MMKSSSSLFGLGIFVCIGFFFLPVFVHGATLYVDGTLTQDCTSGNYSISNHTCAGTDGAAYNTLQEAANVVQAGDTVLVRGGVYTQQDSNKPVLDIHTSGTANAQIVFKNYQNEKPVIDGQWIINQGIRIGAESNQVCSGYGLYGNFITIDGFEIKNVVTGGTNGMGILIRLADNVTIKNSKIYRDGEYNFYGGSGIYLGGARNATIEYNEIYNFLTGINAESAICTTETTFSSQNLIIGWNHIHHIHGDRVSVPTGAGNAEGIATRGSMGALVEHNVIHDSDDNQVGGGYCNGEYTIRNNIVFFGNPYDTNSSNSVSPGSGNGIKTKPASGCSDSSGAKVRVYNNISFYNRGDGFEINIFNNSQGQDIYDNIAFNNYGRGFSIPHVGTYHSQVKNNAALRNVGIDLDHTPQSVGTSDYNYIGQRDPSNIREGVHSIFSIDPKFNNLVLLDGFSYGADGKIATIPNALKSLNNQSANFSSTQAAISYIEQLMSDVFGLKSNSLLVDSGTIIPGVTSAFNGLAPDIGSFESPYTRTTPLPSPLPLPTASPSVSSTPLSSPSPSLTPVSSPTPSIVPSGAPQHLQATPGNGRVTLTWDAVPGALFYTVYRQDGTLFYNQGTTTNPSFTSAGLANGYPYTFKVSATDSSLHESFSDSVTATPSATAPTPSLVPSPPFPPLNTPTPSLQPDSLDLLKSKIRTLQLQIIKLLQLLIQIYTTKLNTIHR